jgi:hypothetical protein
MLTKPKPRMAERLPLAADRLVEVAIAALCDARTVERYLAGLHMLRATESLITKAIRELPEPAQLQIPSVEQGGQQHPREPLLGGQSATSSDHSPVPKVSVVTTVDAPLSLAGESAHVETGMARSDARESQTARTPSPYCKDPVSAPARAAAGGDVLGAASIPAPPERCAQLNAETPPYRPKRCHVTLLVVGPDGSESEVRA